MRKERLELSRVAPLEPKSSASTNSATFAVVGLYPKRGVPDAAARARRDRYNPGNSSASSHPLPVEHYENFPVASWLLPASMREPIEAIYGFARGADDIADEGDSADAERLGRLDGYLEALRAIDDGRMPSPRFSRIASAVHEYGLPTALLADLIDAFKQDVVKKRYASFAELMDYSRRSANPVGRLVLHVFARSHTRFAGAAFAAQSDRICSALQLVNFWQDVAIDWAKGRVYLPQEDLARYAIEERSIAAGVADERWASLMAFECARARAMLVEGTPLARALPGRLGLEIRATILGGLAILDRIDAARGDVFRHRPVLDRAAWLQILWRTLTRKAPR